MPVHIHFPKSLYIFQDRLKIFPVGFLFPAALEILRVVWISAVDNMGRSNDKVKGVHPEQIPKISRQMGLKAKLDPKAEGNLIFILFFQPGKLAAVCGDVKRKIQIIWSGGIIRVQMLGKTDPF